MRAVRRAPRPTLPRRRGVHGRSDRRRERGRTSGRLEGGEDATELVETYRDNGLEEWCRLRLDLRCEDETIVVDPDCLRMFLDYDEIGRLTRLDQRDAIDVIADAIEAEVEAEDLWGVCVVREYQPGLRHSTAEGVERLLDRVLIDGCGDLRAAILGGAVEVRS